MSVDVPLVTQQSRLCQSVRVESSERRCDT